MSLFDWFAKRRKKDSPAPQRPERDIADGLWSKCDACGAMAYTKDLRANHMVCTECNHHMRVESEERINQLADAGTWQELNDSLVPSDPLEFEDRKAYRDRLAEAQDQTGLADAIRTGRAALEGMPVALAVMDFRFLGGSMGSVVGEKLCRLIEYATAEGLPAIAVCASGGARMQEGMLSLMQMAKISGALERHRRACQLYMSVLTHPTTGGVTASFGMLGDIILAEPKALIGFAGRRVIEQTLRQKIPEGFQTAEYLLEHGFVDAVVARPQLKARLAQLLRLHQPALPLLATPSPNGSAQKPSHQGSLSLQSEGASDAPPQ